MPGIHHVEIWVADIDEARQEWGWLLIRLGFSAEPEWPGGQSWEAAGAYLTLTTSPNLSQPDHDRRQPGMNHLAFHGGSRDDVDAVMAEAPGHGWRPLYHERYPYAGGELHYAGWLENSAGFKAEIVAEQSVDQAD
ncbi:VOC family protein [Psychromicrobium sp. YIM B11713]|uniref:VOC family protein n=1 Tax=Psychromicrobium sp. YIM B11713 TaxID=3145233 RepID=UPI00374E849C